MYLTTKDNAGCTINDSICVKEVEPLSNLRAINKSEKKLRDQNTIRTKGVLLSASRCVWEIRTRVVKWKVYTGEGECEEISGAIKRMGRRHGMRQSATDPCAECVRVSGMGKL